MKKYPDLQPEVSIYERLIVANSNAGCHLRVRELVEELHNNIIKPSSMINDRYAEALRRIRDYEQELLA